MTYLQENPGQHWVQIMVGLSNMPRGTLAYLLKEKHGFHKDADGRWFIGESEVTNEVK